MSDFFAPIGGGGMSTDPPNPDFKPPDLKKAPGMPKLPEAERLFAVQNNLLRALQAHDKGSDEGAEHFLRQSYKGLNSYLKEHG